MTPAEHGQERHPTVWAYEQACKALAAAHDRERVLVEALRWNLPTIRTAVLNGEYATSGKKAVDRLYAALQTVSGQE